MPEIQPVITEHRLVAGWCPCCQVWVKPDLPVEVGRSAFGPRLQAWVAILTGRFRQSRRQVVDLLRELCGVNISLGSIQSLCEETSEALAIPYGEAKKALAQAETAHLDETGWKEKGKCHWLWVAVTRLTTVFMVSCSRGRQALRELIGESFEGILHSDRWGAYNMVDPLPAPDLLGASEARFSSALRAADSGRTLGRMGTPGDQTPLCRLASLRGQRNLLDRDAVGAGPGRTRLGRLLRRGAACGDPKAEALCRNLLKLWPALLTFAMAPGVEPTNNRAERALRGAVLWRKGCFGNQSENGSRFTERILTTVATLRQQDRNIVEYVVAAIQAHRISQLAPSLLPLKLQLVEAA